MSVYWCVLVFWCHDVSFCLAGIHNYAAEDLDSAVSYLESVVAEDRYPLRELLSPPFKLQHIQVGGNQTWGLIPGSGSEI